ncbi:MAG: sodium-independent anion transporter, partial [Pseudomonadota bacterium]|nr:sodium-independent anion transporter [Pseudomonadota bacterium]
ADPDRVVIDFVNSRVVDHSGLQAIDNLAQRYSALGKRVQLRNLSQDCKALLSRAGLLGEARDATAEYKLNIGAVGTGH